MTALRTVLVLLATLLLGLSLAACAAAPEDASEAGEAPAVGLGGDDGGGPDGAVEDRAEASGGGADAAGAAGADADADAVEAAESAGQGAGAAPTGGAAPRGRRVVTTTIDVAVDDVPAAAQRVRDIALVAGGYVAAEETAGGSGQPRARLTLRVPVAGAADVMTSVAGLGDEVSRTSESEEVETRLVDLESRVATQRAGVERVRALLADAQSLDDVLALERELTRRQADLEALDAQRAALDDRAALATVTVRLTLPEDVEEAVEAEAAPFVRGLQGGWDALAASTAVVLVVLGSLLPFLAVAAVLGGAVLLALRVLRRGGGRATRPPSGPVAPAAAAGPGGPAHNEA